MNFFNEFLHLKAKARMVMVRTIIGSAVFIGILASVFLFLSIQNALVKADVERITKEIEDPKFEAAQKEIDQLTKQIAALNNYLTALEGLDKRIEALHKFTSDENYIIMEALPEGLYLSSFTVQASDITLTGVTGDINLIPAAVENLTNTGLFSVIHPPSTNWRSLDDESEREDPLLELTTDDLRIFGSVGVYEFRIIGTFAQKEGE